MFFDIVEHKIVDGKRSVLYKYDVYEKGDTVMYFYSGQTKLFYIRNDSLNIFFTLRLNTDSYYPDPEKHFVADILTITYKDPMDRFIGIFALNHVVNKRHGQCQINLNFYQKE